MKRIILALLIGLQCLFCSAQTPDQVEKSAQAADQNLSRQQDREAVLEKLESDWLKSPAFVKTVEAQIKDAPKPEWMEKGVPYLEKGKRDVSVFYKKSTDEK